MAITWYSSSGIPADTVGVDGDMCVDYKYNIIYGPRGIVTAGTWASTGRSATGPTGLSMLAGNGIPSSAYGQNGNGYTDTSTGNTYLKSSNAWSLNGNILGPPGPAGFTGLTTQAMSPATQLIANGTTATSTAQYLPITGTTATQYFVPQQSSAFLGFNAANTGVALTINLLDVTAGTTVYSASLAANAQVNAGVFTTTQYPLVAGHLYAWTYTGSGTANLVLNPYYLTAAAAAAGCVGVFSQFMSPVNNAFTTTAFNAVVPGASSTANVNTRTFQLLRAGAIVGLVPTYAPSVAGAAAASVTWTIKNYTANTTLATGTVTNSGVPQPVSYSSSPIAVPAANTIFITLSGTGTGTFSADMNVIV